MSRLNLIEAQHGNHRLTEGSATSSENTNSSVATNSEIAGNSEITNSEVTNSEITNSEVTTSNENANINNFQFGHYQATNGRISPLPDGDRKNKITLKITRSPRAGSLDVAEDLSSKNVEPLKIKTRGWNGNSGNLENGVAKNANLENGDIKNGNLENGNHENGNSENENGPLETVETDDNMEDEKDEIDENEEIDDESENSEKSDISEQYNGISAYKSNYSPRTSTRLKTKQKEPSSVPSEPNRRTSRRLQTVKTEVEVSETSESSVRRSSRRIQKRVHSTDEEDEDEDDDVEEDEEDDEEDEEGEDEDEKENEAENTVEENIEENHSDDEINEIHAKSSRNHPKSYKNRKNSSFHQRISLTRSPLTRNTDSRTSEKIDEKPSRLSSAEKHLAISGPFIPSASTNETIPYEMETLQAALRSTIEGNDDRLDKHKIDTTYRALQDYSIALRHNCLRTTQKIRNLAALKETVVEKLEKNQITPIEVFKSIRESMEITETDGGVKIRKTDFDDKQNASKTAIKTTSEGRSDPASKLTSENSTVRQITFKKPIALKRNPLQYVGENIDWRAHFTEINTSDELCMKEIFVENKCNKDDRKDDLPDKICVCYCHQVSISKNATTYQNCPVIRLPIEVQKMQSSMQNSVNVSQPPFQQVGAKNLLFRSQNPVQNNNSDQRPPFSQRQHLNERMPASQFSNQSQKNFPQNRQNTNFHQKPYIQNSHLQGPNQQINLPRHPQHNHPTQNHLKNHSQNQQRPPQQQPHPQMYPPPHGPPQGSPQQQLSHPHQTPPTFHSPNPGRQHPQQHQHSTQQQHFNAAPNKTSMQPPQPPQFHSPGSDHGSSPRVPRANIVRWTHEETEALKKLLGPLSPHEKVTLERCRELAAHLEGRTYTQVMSRIQTLQRQALKEYMRREEINTQQVDACAPAMDEVKTKPGKQPQTDTKK